MDMKNLTKKGLEKLIDDVSMGLTAVLAKAESEGAVEGQTLAKADPGQEAPAEKVPAGSSSESSDSSPAKEESSSPAPAADASPAEETPGEAPAAEGAPAPGAEGGEPAEDTGGTVEQLQAEYAALPVEEQKMHLLALKAALMSTLASQGGEGDAGVAPEGMPAPDASAAPAAPEAPAAAPAPEQTEMPPMAKSENQALALELETLKKALSDKEEIIASTNQMATAFKNFLERQNGRRLSVASASVMPKTQSDLNKSEGIDVSSLSPAEINRKLTEVVASGTLKKSDKDLVLKYVAGRDKKDVGTIAHLLK